jgi:hypothetical protein
MGNSLQDTNPQKAINFFQQSYDLSGSVDCLARIGRSHLVLGDTDKAREYFDKVLSLKPLDAVAITNLYIMGEPATKFRDQLSELIQWNDSIATQTVHVLAVEAARDSGVPVPAEWVLTAELRFQRILHGEGLGDEQVCLGLALAKWYRRRGDQEKAGYFRKAGGSTKQRFIKSLFWPGGRWLPKHLPD